MHFTNVWRDEKETFPVATCWQMEIFPVAFDCVNYWFKWIRVTGRFWTPAERKGLEVKEGTLCGRRGWNDWGKTNDAGPAPPHTSRFPAAQRLQESLGARLSRESCAYSCILFLQAAPDNTRLFIALGSFSACLSKGRPCLQVTKVSCKQSKQKARANKLSTDQRRHQVERKNDLFTFGKKDLSTNKGLVLGVTTSAKEKNIRANPIKN